VAAEIRRGIFASNVRVALTSEFVRPVPDDLSFARGRWKDAISLVAYSYISLLVSTLAGQAPMRPNNS